MRLFEPRLCSFVRANAERLAGMSDRTLQGRREDDIGVQLLARVDECRRDATKEALKRLFPRLESVWGNHFYGSDSLPRWDREHRICSPRRFPAYFTFGIGDDVLAKAELDAFLAEAT